MKDLILQKLKEHLWFRERKNRREGFAKYLIGKYKLDIPIGTMIDILADGDTMDRAWRQCLLENEDLRGEDYENKKVLEQEKILDLGYEVGLTKLDI